MAKILPEILINPNRAPSELEVLKTIRERVSDEWLVFQGFEFRTYKRKFRNDPTSAPTQFKGGTIQDGEIDFLFFKPGIGFVVLEVKGGEITYDDGSWFQNKNPIDPFFQARKGAYYIKNLLEKRLDNDRNFSFAYAVCFPEVCRRFTDEELPADSQGLVITRADLDNIGLKIGVILEKYSTKIMGKQAALGLDEVKSALLPVFDYRIPMSDLFQKENAKMLKLTDEQYDLFRAMRQFKRLRVRGCAGSGKTLMAVKKAQELSEAGQKVGIFCFNTILASQINKAAGDSRGRITADALLEYCAREVGIPKPELAHKRNDPDFWDKELPERWEQVMGHEKAIPEFDAILIDEAQDFTESAWDMVKSMVGDSTEKTFYIFYDPRQNVYQRNLDCIPSFGIPDIILEKNCRNTRAICREMERHGGPAIHVPPDTPQGKDVVYRDAGSEDEAADIVRDIIKGLAKEEGLLDLHENLVVLGSHQYRHTPFHASPRIKGCQYSLANGLKGSNRSIPYLTSMKFKGCESPIVILYDVDPEDPHWAVPENIYTAMSRATHLLYVIRRARP